jgi:SAM-dependent methyltransferase
VQNGREGQLPVNFMATLEWLIKVHSSGYSSGDILSWFDWLRWKEERKIGGSYRRMFLESFVKCITPKSRVLEIGPGRGSWSRAILKYIPEGELHTVDLHDVTPWLSPQEFGGRLHCHQVEDNSFTGVPDDYFDLFWSFGVLCHQNEKQLREILSNSFRKLRSGGIAIHQYADWDKLNDLEWNKKYGVPSAFREQGDDDVWWPRNSKKKMRKICEDAGWQVVTEDMGFFRRDSVIQLSKQ